MLTWSLALRSIFGPNNLVVPTRHFDRDRVPQHKYKCIVENPGENVWNNFRKRRTLKIPGQTRECSTTWLWDLYIGNCPKFGSSRNIKQEHLSVFAVHGCHTASTNESMSL
jgi:hypothetical protein